MIFRHVDHDLGLALGGDRHDRLALGDDLSDLGAHHGHDAAARRAKDGVLQPVARELELALVGLGRRLRLLRAGLRLLFVGCAHRAVGLQRFQALAVRFGLARLRLGGDELLARGFLGEPVVDVVEHRQHVALAHALADVDLALRDLAADAKALIDLVARLHRAEIAIGFARLVVAQLDGANHARAPRPGACPARSQEALELRRVTA